MGEVVLDVREEPKRKYSFTTEPYLHCKERHHLTFLPLVRYIRYLRKFLWATFTRYQIKPQLYLIGETDKEGLTVVGPFRLGYD